MKLRELISAGIGAAVGLCLAVWVYRKSIRKPPNTPAQPERGGGGEELDPAVHGEFVGPDNPRPTTEAWYEQKAEEVIETAGADSSTPDELATLLAIKYPKADQGAAKAYIENAIE